MKWSELKRIAIQHGWYLIRSGRAHDVYGHPEKKNVILFPRHDSKEVKTGIYFKIKKEIGF